MKIYSTNSNYFIAVLMLSAILLSGCGSSSITVKPNYNSPLFKKDSLSNIQIVKTIDQRNSHEKYNAGIAQVGLFNKKVPYLLTEPVNEFVKNAVTNILESKTTDTLFVPITIIIDSFAVYEKETLFSENGHFDCKLRFLYPAFSDSIIVINTLSNKISSGMDVTNSLEELMYGGVTECTNQFVKVFNTRKDKYFINENRVNEIKIDSINTDKVIAVNDTTPVIKDDYVSNLGATYIQGNNIVNGFQFTYQTYGAKEISKQYQHGFGYSLIYYDIENRKSSINGNFVGFNYRYSMRYSLSHSRNGLYFGASIRLTLGSENIKYYNETKTNFFVGPTLEEIIGVSIAERAFIEAGLFQIKHFGSDLLPDDLGFNVGINFGI